jgi:sulfur relay (sulfurtransferase) complex TusBCD TusD component (DsrE family)
MGSRGIDNANLTEGTRRSTLDEVAEWSGWAEKVATF